MLQKTRVMGPRLVFKMLFQSCKHSCRKKSCSPQRGSKKSTENATLVKEVKLGVYSYGRKGKHNQREMTARVPIPCHLGFQSVVFLWLIGLWNSDEQNQREIMKDVD